MIAFVMFTIFVFVCGFVMGAAVGLPQFKPKRPTLPLARVLHDASWKRLDIPTVQRRQQRIQVIDV